MNCVRKQQIFTHFSLFSQKFVVPLPPQCDAKVSLNDKPKEK